MMQIQLTVNGQSVTLTAAPNTLLVQALREHLNLTGTHVGCDTAQCGACTVLMNGNAIKSCNVLLAQAQQQVFDGVVVVENVNRVNIIGMLYAALCPLFFAFKAIFVGLFVGDAALFFPALDLLHDGAGVGQEHVCPAHDFPIIEHGFEVRPSLADRHVGQIDRLTAAGQCAVWDDAVLTDQVKQGRLCGFVFLPADRDRQRQQDAPFTAIFGRP